MRKNVKETTIVQQEITWISNDGLVFENEKDCKAWENSYRGMLNTSFLNLATEVNLIEIGFPYSNEGDVGYVIFPKSVTDITMINAVIQEHENRSAEVRKFSTDAIGKKIIFSFNEMYSNDIFTSEWTIVKTLDELKEEITNAWNSIDKKFERLAEAPVENQI